MAFKKPSVAPEPIPEPTVTEGTFYDHSMTGRALLEAYCLENGLSWGVTNYSVSGNTIQANVILGPLYVVKCEGNKLDDALRDLVKELTGD